MNNLKQKEFDKSATLVSYYPGDGGLAFVFQDRNNQAAGVKVTAQDAMEYMIRNYPKTRGYRLVILNGDQVRGFRPIERVGKDELRLDGKTIFYTLVGRDVLLCDSNADNIHHVSTKARVRFFLEHEESLKNAFDFNPMDGAHDKIANAVLGIEAQLEELEEYLQALGARDTDLNNLRSAKAFIFKLPR